MGRILQRLKSVDFYKKLPQDLTEATLTGAWISITAAVLISCLLVAEFSSFLSLKVQSQMVVDRSTQHELLRVNFNISFMALSCEFATVDVSDALGTKRLNLTKTVHKVPINLDLQKMGVATEDVHKPAPKYDDEGSIEDAGINYAVPLSHDNFEATLARYPIVVVNFFAPWCHWCQRLAPTWEKATMDVHNKYPEWDGRIRFAKVDCTVEQELCRKHIINGFPSLRVFRKGHDEITIQGQADHEAYTGDRTVEALTQFADQLVPSAGQPHRKLANLTAAPKSSGCNMFGYVMIKKVPGTMHFKAHGEGHSFDHQWMNMTHFVHYFNFGNRPSPRMYAELVRMHPLGLARDWNDKLSGQLYVSEHAQHTHEHYLQVVRTTIQPRDRRMHYDAYEYNLHSHTFTSDDIPAAKVTYDLSPVQIVVQEQPRAWYHFLTTTCAIIGGVFTVAGILDSLLYQSIKLAKKVELGKQG